MPLSPSGRQPNLSPPQSPHPQHLRTAPLPNRKATHSRPAFPQIGGEVQTKVLNNTDLGSTLSKGSLITDLKAETPEENWEDSSSSQSQSRGTFAKNLKMPELNFAQVTNVVTPDEDGQSCPVISRWCYMQPHRPSALAKDQFLHITSVSDSRPLRLSPAFLQDRRPSLSTANKTHRSNIRVKTQRAQRPYRAYITRMVRALKTIRLSRCHR